MLLDVGQEVLPRAARPDRRASCWYVLERRPQRVLFFVIDEYEKLTVFVIKWVRHTFSFSADVAS